MLLLSQVDKNVLVMAHRLLWEANCEPKNIDYQVTTYKANKDAVESMCQTSSGCIYLSLDSYASSLHYQNDPTLGCSSNFVTVLFYKTSCLASEPVGN